MSAIDTAHKDCAECARMRPFILKIINAADGESLQEAAHAAMDAGTASDDSVHGFMWGQQLGEAYRESCARLGLMEVGE